MAEERVLKVEEDEEDFRSCCEDEDELNEIEEEEEEHIKMLDSDEKHSVKMYFKGVSVACPGDYSGSRISGIGVVIESLVCNDSPLQVQKKLDFYVEELVADYLALLDGLSLAIQNNFERVFAFTDSQVLHNQIIHNEVIENPLLLALKERIMEQATNIETFVLKFVPTIDLDKASHLARVAVGIVSSLPDGKDLAENCPICCEEKLSSMMLKLKCSHKFCSHCMITYVEDKVKSAQVPIKCPQSKCRYLISASECMSFLPVTSYESLERALLEANVLSSNNKFYCPYSSCSVLIDPHECLSTRASSSTQSDNGGCCVECPVCERFVCVECEAPWHSTMTCEEYRNTRWRRCQLCESLVELARGCYHMTCWCGHEFCYSCDAEYRDGQQTCQCAFWDEDYSEEEERRQVEATTYPPAQQLEQWAWDSFESLPMDAYSDQERSQLALIQRFLAGGFSFSDHYNPTCQSPPRCTDSYADAMKDLHQLPWLERFVSVISDDYYEDYVH